MAKSPRARDAFINSHVYLFQSVFEISPLTVVPSRAPLDLAKDDDALVEPGSLGVLSACSAPVHTGAIAPLRQVESDALVPHYDHDRRELTLAGFVVRRFTRRAENQEKILAVFSEENWPPRIDDPLHGPCDDTFKRLHDTLSALNDAIEKQALHAAAPYSIRFSADGTGQGIRWHVRDRG